MLKKNNRLNSEEFQEVFKKGKRYFFKNFLFIIYQNNKNFKAGISIPKKEFKLAIQRNKIKRQIHYLLKENLFKKNHIIIQLKKNFNINNIQQELKNFTDKML